MLLVSKHMDVSVCFDKRMIGSINEGDDNDG